MHFSSWIGASALVLLAAWLTHVMFSFRTNVLQARQSGIRYVLVPVHIISPSWLLAQVILLPLLKRMPSFCTDWWLPIALPQRVWHQGHGPFERVGADTFLAISPWGKVLWTCEPEVILEVERRRKDFPKPRNLMQVLNVFGPTLTASEGEEARTYRRIASRAFNEATIKQAWSLSLAETTTMLDRWFSLSKSGIAQVTALGADTARLTLHIISSAMYGQQLEWPALDTSNKKQQRVGGHALSFSGAIAEVLELTPVIFLIPMLVLRYSPFRVHKRAYRAYHEWLRYMIEIRGEKEAELRRLGMAKEPNYLDSIVNAGMSPSERSFGRADAPRISQEAVMGNMFIIFLGGHETTANTVTFAMVMLACFPQTQQKLQKALDHVLGDRPPSQWDFDEDLAALQATFVGDFLNEILRLFAILPFIPKATEEVTQPLTVEGRQCVVPPDTLILLNTAAAHRNPKYWDPAPSTRHSAGERAPFPAASFQPERWTSKEFDPPRGAFVPFSTGFRVCVGKRLAKVELIAVLARVFKDYSVELSVPKRRGAKGRKEAWLETRSHAEYRISEGVELSMSLKMLQEIDLHFTRRGQEEWFDME